MTCQFVYFLQINTLARAQRQQVHLIYFARVQQPLLQQADLTCTVLKQAKFLSQGMFYQFQKDSFRTVYKVLMNTMKRIIH